MRGLPHCCVTLSHHLDAALCTRCRLYIEQILPSRLRGFGVPKPWYFPCTTRFWRRTLGFGSRLSSAMAKSGVSPTDQISHSAVSPLASSASVEPPDAELRDRAAAGRAVTVLSLRKEFKTPDGIKVAVSDASLTFYEGQISVLLGTYCKVTSRLIDLRCLVLGRS